MVKLEMETISPALTDNKQCKDRHDTLSNEIQELEEKHEKEQTKLAGATAEENTNVDTGR